MTTYIGIDISKKFLQIYIPIIDNSFSVANNQSGFDKLVSCLNKHYNNLLDLIIVFAPTGGKTIAGFS